MLRAVLGGLKNWSQYLNAGESKTINNVNGFVFVRCKYSYAGYLLYLVTFGDVVLVTNPAGYPITVELTHTHDNILTVTNTSAEQRYIEILYQYLP